MDTLEILLVEDNPGDVWLTREAFKESHLAYHLNVASDGAKALAWLKKAASDPTVTLPRIILLDLNLPGKNGLEVLTEIRSDVTLQAIPIIILTSSDNDFDVLVAYKKQANGYLVKPANLAQFDAVIDAVVSLCL